MHFSINDDEGRWIKRPPMNINVAWMIVNCSRDVHPLGKRRKVFGRVHPTFVGKIEIRIGQKERFVTGFNDPAGRFARFVGIRGHVLTIRRTDLSGP